MSRNRLAVTSLDKFVAYCVNEGWESLPPKGDWEVARLKRDKKMAIVWRRAANHAGTHLTHLTLDRYSEVLFDQWKRDRNAA